MRGWLEEALVALDLPEEAEGYLLGRGVSESRIRDIGILVWDSSRIRSNAPDLVFRDGAEKRAGYGPRGHRLDGRLCVPLWSPRGRLVGVEFRTWQGEKKVSQYLLPDAEWNPVFVGLTPSAMRRVWDGGSVWLTEGLFDMGAMEHVVPPQDTVLATLRARVSPRHATFLQRFCRGWAHVVYDNDETGRKQTHGYVDAATGKRRWGALEVLTRVGVKARDVPYRGGKDPGEIWEHTGTEGLRRAFGRAL